MHKLMLSLVVVGAITSHAQGQFWWWPPDCTIEPPNPTSDEAITITLGGLYPDSCIPNGSSIAIFGNLIQFDVLRDYPPDIVCMQVISGWSLSETTGPLAVGNYSVAASFYYNGVPMAGPTSACNFSVVAPCPADINRDGTVDVRDFLKLLSLWGTNPGGPPDLNGDGIVNEADFLELLAAWGPCP